MGSLSNIIENLLEMGDAEEVFTKIQKHSGVSYTALVPNLKGF